MAASSASHTEILMNISDDDIDGLANKYRTQTDVKYATGILLNGKKLRERRNYLLRFVAPGNNWREDGTFFVFIEFCVYTVKMTDKTCHNEILMNIPDEELETLADMYREKNKIPYASNFLSNGQRIRKNRSFLMRFSSTGNSWREDGTFFAVLEFPHRYDLGVFSLEASGQKIYEGLMKTRRIHFERLLLFCAIPRSIYPTVLKVIHEKDLKIESDIAHYIYTISKTEALEFDIRCSNEVEVKRLQLEPEHIALVSSLWPKKFPNFEEYLTSIIEQNDCFGVYLAGSGALVSWVLQMEMGNIGIVQTVNNYQKKGYASLLVKRLSREIAEEDEDPTVFIETSDQATQVFFEKLGFSNIGLCNNIELANKR